jgi:hypothetical protein
MNLLASEIGGISAPTTKEQFLSAEAVIKNIRAQIEATIGQSLSQDLSAFGVGHAIGNDAESAFSMNDDEELMFLETRDSLDTLADATFEASFSSDSETSESSFALTGGNLEPRDPVEDDGPRYESDVVVPPPPTGEGPHNYTHQSGTSSFSAFELF